MQNNPRILIWEKKAKIKYDANKEPNPLWNLKKMQEFSYSEESQIETNLKVGKKLHFHTTIYTHL